MSNSNWIQEEENKVSQKVENGTPLINEKGIRTQNSDGFKVIGFPWDGFDKASRNLDSSITSTNVNGYTKEVMKELREITGLSERKIIAKVMAEFCVAAAEKIEAEGSKGFQITDITSQMAKR